MHSRDGPTGTGDPGRRRASHAEGGLIVPGSTNRCGKIARAIAVSLLGVALACMFLATPVTAQQSVLLLNQNSGAVGPTVLANSLRSVLLRSPRSVDLYVEAIDQDRFPEPEHFETVTRYLRDKYAERPIDLVIAAGGSVSRFVAEHRESLFPKAPVVFVGVDDTAPIEPALPDGWTGFLRERNVSKTLDLALKLQPEAENVVLVAGAGPGSREWTEAAHGQLDPYRDRLEIRSLVGLPLEDLLWRLGALPPRTIVLFLTMAEDGDGQRFVPVPSIVPAISEASSAPVYGMYSTLLGRGVVGGWVDDFEMLGRAVADRALRILAGEDPSTIPVEVSHSQFLVDWRELRRWGLDETRLPAGTIVQFREPSVWSRYGIEILGVLALLALQTLLIAALWLRSRRRKAEMELQRTEERYRNVVEAQTDLVCRYLPDTTLTFVNEAYCNYFGRCREELLGTSFLGLIPESAHERTIRVVESLVTDPRTETHEHEVMRPDGTVGWQQWVNQAITNEHGVVIELQGIGRDMTALRQAEMEAERQREQVTHLTRVATLGEFTGALAHELAQPLAAILANAGAAEAMLEHEPADLAEIRAILEDIVADDQRAVEVIKRLRSLLKQGVTERRQVDAHAVIRDTIALASARLTERGVQLSARLAAEPSCVLADPIQVQQILLNLLMNAIEAVDENEPSERTVTLSTAHRGSELLELSVSDNGCGLPTGDPNRVFEPFYTTKGSGLGLGLSICRSIITAHGGQLTASVNPDGGATFRFTLPTANPDLVH